MIKNVHGNTVDYLGSAIVAGRFNDNERMEIFDVGFLM